MKRRFKNEKYNHLAEVEHVFKAEVNTENDSSKITIYGEIGDYWWDSTSAADVERALKDVTTNTVHVHLNSGGGDAFDGIAIYNQLKNHSAKVVVHIDGLAASAASIIAMAGDEILMNTGTMLMIHEASTFAWGTKSEIQKTMNALTGLDKSLVDVYMTRFKGERSEIETLLNNETWFTADEAAAVGLVDEVKEVEEAEATAASAEEFKASILARFKKADPHPSQASVESPTKENILSRFKRAE